MSTIGNSAITSAASYASIAPQNGPSLQSFAQLNLSEAQRASLRTIFANAKKTGESSADVAQKVVNVLTAVQPAAPAASASFTTQAPVSKSADASAQPAYISPLLRRVLNIYGPTTIDEKW